MSRDDFFIGWAERPPRSHRRFLLAAGLGLTIGGGALAAALASNRPQVGDGVWEMGHVVTLRGQLSRHPYPTLRTMELGQSVRTVFLASNGKGIPVIDAALFGGAVSATGTLITRGHHAMMAVDGLAQSPDAIALGPPEEVDHGPVLLAGEVLDAKCWFGAMRPGFGKTHKSCAALCARGGLPLAFCRADACGDGDDALLLTTERGLAFGRDIIPLVADPVSVMGRLIEVGDVMQVRAPLSAIRRL